MKTMTVTALVFISILAYSQDVCSYSQEYVDSVEFKLEMCQESWNLPEMGFWNKKEITITDTVNEKFIGIRLYDDRVYFWIKEMKSDTLELELQQYFNQ